jgi:hypothetical protein
MSGIFPDCKTFVDMRLQLSPHLVKKNFQLFINQEFYSEESLRDFILAHFRRDTLCFLQCLFQECLYISIYIEDQVLARCKRRRCWADVYI